MPADRRLVNAFRGVAAAALPDDALRHERAARAAIRGDATINPEAIRPVLPLIPFAWYLAGTVTAGGNVAAELTLPQTARVRRLDVRAKTAPSGGPLIVVVADAGGTWSENVAIEAGASAGFSPVDQTFPAGTVLRLTISAANAAADVTVQVAYLPVTG